MKPLATFPQAVLEPGCGDVGRLRKVSKFTKVLEGIF
jgi:hypothetical protein